MWVGGGPMLDEVRDLVSRRGLSHRLLLAGERRDVPDLLPAFDVFAMSSRYEGLPCVVVEAMRCGLPVVATAVNSVPDLVVPGASGVLVPPAQPAALAAAVDGLLDDPLTALRLAREGQQRGRRHLRRDRARDRPRPGLLPHPGPPTTRSSLEVTAMSRRPDRRIPPVPPARVDTLPARRPSRGRSP